MPITGRSPRHTVRPDSPWGSQKLFYMAMFAIASVAVYRWGLATAQPPKPTKSYTSTATVRLQGEPHTATNPEAIKRHITSPQHIYRAVGQLGLSAKPPPDEAPRATANRVIEQVSRNLRVTTDGTSVPGELAISITYTNRSPRYSAQLANILAESYADDYRTQWKRRTYRAYTDAREASERAEREFLQAKARLDEFSKRQFGPPQVEPPAEQSGHDPQQTDDGRATSIELEVSDSPTPTPATRPKPPLVDNPKWAELNERLAVLKRRRAELLVDRTPLHPAVQDTQQQIAELKQQLSETPKKIPPESSGQPAEKNSSSDAQGSAAPTEQPPGADPIDSQPPEVAPGQTALDRAETARQFRKLKEASDRATEAYRQAVQLERQAWQQHQQEPRIELDLAEPPRPGAIEYAPPNGQAAAPPAADRLSLLWVALAAGIVVTAGVGMISAGAAIDPALTTLDQVRNVLPVPIVGTVPETSPPTRPKPARRRRPVIRTALIIGGLGLIAGCVGLLLWAWGS